METHRTVEYDHQVAIIGAGLSGLLACKYALSKGFRQVVVFESQSTIGGVWRKTIHTTKLQTPKFFYEFSDFPWPPSVTQEFPDYNQVLHYIHSYALHFDLLRRIAFNSKVLSLRYDGPPEEEILAWTQWGGTGHLFPPSYTNFNDEVDAAANRNWKWNITVQDTRSLSTEVHQANFVILCVGRFSGIPSIPEFPPGKGIEYFEGEVIHSMDYAEMDSNTAAQFVKGRRITVVGLQKSAMDIAMECSAINGVEKPCTVVYRREHWNLPNYLPWGVPLAFLYLNRFAELLLHKPGEGLVLSLLATILSPLRWGFCKFVESYITWKLGLAKHGMVPRQSFLEEISSCLISTVPEDFYPRVEGGSIKLKKAKSFGFCSRGIIVEGEGGGEEVVETDAVILATGYRGVDKFRNIFASQTFGDLLAGPRGKAVPLYRECIHPRIPQLAIIGFSESASNLYTSEMRCRWLGELLGGTFKLPDVKTMEKDIGEWDRHYKGYSGENYRRSCIAAVHIWYNDQLCKDMGWNPRRKSGLLAELFEPYGPSDYARPN